MMVCHVQDYLLLGFCSSSGVSEFIKTIKTKSHASSRRRVLVHAKIMVLTQLGPDRQASHSTCGHRGGKGISTSTWLYRQFRKFKLCGHRSLIAFKPAPCLPFDCLPQCSLATPRHLASVFTLFLEQAKR